MMIRNLPSYLNSRLINIVCLFHTEDTRIKLGYKPILKELIQDTKTLETTGIEIVDGKTCHTVTGTVVLFSADNLFAHGMLGFQESFTHGYIRRLCYATADNIRDYHRIRDFKQRTAKQHKKDVQDCDKRNTGVKRKSPFNDLKFFNVIDNYCVDAMHDIFEGIFLMC